METREIELLIFAGSVILFFLGLFILLFLIFYQRKQKLHQLRISELHRESLQTQLEIQEQTLKTISQEIHDNIGQALSLAKLNLSTMLLTHGGDLREKIIDSKYLVSKAIGDLRDLSHSLDTDYVQGMGLQRAIEYELEMIRKSGTISVEMDVSGNPIRFDKQKELILFRIVQETFNNIIKHAEATTIRVAMDYQATHLHLQVSDDGKGVDLTPLSQDQPGSFGLGIRNMHNRARLISGDFQMNSAIGKGTTISIHLPIASNHESESAS